MDWYNFEGKRIVILGLARQGSALARFFMGRDAQVVISDAAPADRLQSSVVALNGLPAELALGGHPYTLLDGCDLLCLSGGVPMQLPIVQQAIARGIRLSNDSLLTLQLCRQQGLGPAIAVTGSSGKTTTTTLVGAMLEASGKRVHVGGNIGTPLIDRLDTVQAGEPIVLELSSFQLELFDTTLAYGPLENIGPEIAAILNITPNHLDRHKSMADYAQAKLNLLSSLPQGATVVLNADDAVTAHLLGERAEETPQLPSDWMLDEVLRRGREELQVKNATLTQYGIKPGMPDGARRVEGRLMYDDKQICLQDEVKLRGEHNISNVLAAAAISCAAGASLDGVRSVVTSFAGVAHRLEIVISQDGVTWINDSIATSPERAIAALRSFDADGATLILLAGGKDKDLPWTTFADEAIARVSMLIGFGDAGPMIVETVQERATSADHRAPSCALVQRLDEAVDLASRVAQPGSIVLLSPGGTSYDAYQDFEARGEHFRQLILRQPSTLSESLQ